MNFKNIPFFRILIILVFSGCLYIYFTQMDIGRYQAIPGGLLVDTKTGETFYQTTERKAGYQDKWQKLIAPVRK